MKKVHIIAILVLILVAHVLIIKYRRAGNDFEYQPPSNEVIAEHLAKQIAALKLLSVSETLQRLDRMEYYRYPGAFVGSGTVFELDRDGNITAEGLYKQNKIEVEQVLSSRLFRKALQDMGKLPKDQASALLEEELVVALSRYLDLYQDFFESHPLNVSEGKTADGQPFIVGIKIIGESADGQPVLLGLRYKIFSLILIAGSLELANIHEKIREIDIIAKNQKADVCRINDANVRMNYTFGTLLDNNLILASGLYGTSQRKGDTALAHFADRFAIHQIVDFSASGTEYDTMVLHGVQELVPDEEYINVRYFEQMTNEDLDELRRILALP